MTLITLDRYIVYTGPYKKFVAKDRVTPLTVQVDKISSVTSGKMRVFEEYADRTEQAEIDARYRDQTSTVIKLDGEKYYVPHSVEEVTRLAERANAANNNTAFEFNGLATESVQQAQEAEPNRSVGPTTAPKQPTLKPV